jgi:Glycosyl transferase family 2
VKSLNVFVCIPSGSHWLADFGKSLALMFSYYSHVKVPGYGQQKLSLVTMESSMLGQARETLVKRALKEKADYVLFLDSDMVFPHDTIHRLLKHAKEFICGAYTCRTYPVRPTAVGYDGKKINSLDRKGIEKIQHAGFGVCLIKLDVVKKLRPPLFLMDFIPALGTQCGEDVYFSQKMAEIGVDLWVDHDLSKELGHVGKRIYSFKDIDPKDLESHNSILE